MPHDTMTFQQRLQKNQVVLAPCIYDALSALIAEQSGFEALYLSGASIAYTRLGRSDVGLTTATEEVIGRQTQVGVIGTGPKAMGVRRHL
jgi:2-methylisocitrate lyase-like PEP mutase family enzyme